MVIAEVFIINWNSARTMQKARIDPSRISMLVSRARSRVEKKGEEGSSHSRSSGKAKQNRTRDMVGVIVRSVAKGLLMPKDSFWRRICVMLHRSPPKTEADITRKKPNVSN
eukprot:Lithocolla_globosa_v1_NODE_5751_length_1191_cov_7.816901.p3 type:complete len:111 gc:universal NODE_5751_length_1191_cov_7.816901:242-574(+)